jgi:hypothetical protein
MNSVMSSSNTTAILEMLEGGTIEVEGLLPWGSNHTFLAHISHGQGRIDAIYKPSRGERPLWDFARGTLCRRERAAFVVSQALQWYLVPPTVLRDAPLGWGSLQHFVDHDPQEHYLTLQGRFLEQAQRIALFDVLVNNADRKSGHVIVGSGERLWAIDHGVCFHADYKLRSVIWDFSGEPIPADMLECLLAFQSRLDGADSSLHIEMTELLSPREYSALQRRLESLIERSIFPNPGPGRHYPWPLV